MNSLAAAVGSTTRSAIELNKAIEHLFTFIKSGARLEILDFLILPSRHVTSSPPSHPQTLKQGREQAGAPPGYGGAALLMSISLRILTSASGQAHQTLSLCPVGLDLLPPHSDFQYLPDPPTLQFLVLPSGPRPAIQWVGSILELWVRGFQSLTSPCQ